MPPCRSLRFFAPVAGLSACVLVFLLLFAMPACGQQKMTDASIPDGALRLDESFPNLRFNRPVDFQSPGDGSGRLFVVEQAGVIKVFDNRSDIGSANVFLDIRGRVRDQGNEEGLLGLAFHPNFASNGYFYVDYTASNPRRTVVTRYRADPNNPDRVLTDSATVILEVNQPYSNHNGGQIVFGPDGYLYVALGDGGSGGDPHDHGENPATLLGSILRIDVDGGSPYAIPSDNPFVGNNQGYREEIYAYGLRNPWRISFDSSTGRLWAADVGQNLYEEVNIIEKGANYGWDVMEGLHCYEPTMGCNQTGLTLPVWEYSHDLGISITGGYAYRGSSASSLAGRYVFADYGTGRIWALTYDGAQAQVQEIMNTGLSISSFGVDAQQELYALAFNGRIYRFTEASLPPVTITAAATATEGAAANFTVTSSPAPSANLTVNLSVADAPHSDFVAAANEGAGKTVTVTVETGNGYMVGNPGSASVTVSDNDPTMVTLSGAAGNLIEGDAKDILLTLGRGLRQGETLTAPLTFAGAATRNSDYALACPSPLPAGVTCSNLNSGSAQVAFTGPATGTTATSVTIALTAMADNVAEAAAETIQIGLGALTATGLGGGASGVDNLADFTIADPPPVIPPTGPPRSTPEVTLSASPNPVTEGETITVTATLSEALATDVAIPLAITAGAAEAGDYGPLASIAIAANQTSGTGAIATNVDDDADDETFTVALGDLPGGVQPGSPSSVELTIADAQSVTSVEGEEEIPEAFALEQNYPNPFNPETTIRYALPQPGKVRLAVYDLMGHELAVLVDELKSAGWHEIRFPAAALPSGSYVYRLQAQDKVMTDMMTLVK